MAERMTATEAARNFSDLLNRVRYGRETFVILRGGEAVGQLGPVESGPPVTLRGLVDLLAGLGVPDERFAEDLEEIQASQLPADEIPWPS